MLPRFQTVVVSSRHEHDLAKASLLYFGYDYVMVAAQYYPSAPSFSPSKSPLPAP